MTDATGAVRCRRVKSDHNEQYSYTGSVDGDDHDGGRLYLPSIVYIVHVLRDAGLAASISFGLLNARHHRDRVDISRPYL